MFRRPESETLDSAIEANRKTVATAQDVIKQHLSLDGTGPEVAIPAEPANEDKGNGSDPDFWPSHIPIQYYRVNLFTRFWNRLVRLFA